MLRNFLDAMPYPAWIKLVDSSGEQPKFVMWHINDEYSRHFDVSPGRYIGRTDFDIWPTHIASAFYANDLQTLERMSPTCTTEKFPAGVDRAEMQSGSICKWSAAINGRTAIAGQISVTN